MNTIFRLLYLNYRLFSTLQYWAMRRFTRPGLALVVAVVVAATLGVDPENTVGYQSFTLLFSLLLVAFLFVGFFKVRFDAERLLPRFGTVGKPFHYRVAVRNLTGKTQHGLTLLEDFADPRPSFADWKARQFDDERYLRPFSFIRRRRANPFKLAKLKDAAVPAAPPNQEVETRVEVIPLRRGILRFAGLSLARPDPLGLFRAFSKIPLPQSVLILPQRYWLPPIALLGAMKYQQGGVALASNVGLSDEYVSLREYRRGDPVRHIHWRSWAKMGKPIVKEFEDEFFVRHALVLDTFIDRAHSDEFEEAVSVAASFACTVLTQESLLDLLFVGPQAYCFTAGRGLAHADQMLEILASVRPCHEQTFTALENLVLNHASAVSGCVCVLLAWDDERQQLVKKLKMLGLPMLVLVVQPAGKNKPLDPGPMRDEPDRLHFLEIGRIEEQLAVMR